MIQKILNLCKCTLWTPGQGCVWTRLFAKIIYMTHGYNQSSQQLSRIEIQLSRNALCRGPSYLEMYEEIYTSRNIANLDWKGQDRMKWRKNDSEGRATDAVVWADGASSVPEGRSTTQDQQGEYIT
jgi:hypothetical protein